MGDRFAAPARYRVVKMAKPKYDKLELGAARSAHANLEEVPFLAIIEVDREGYVPSCVALRMRISPFLFTARVEPPALQKLQADDAVVAIAPSQPLARLA